MTKTVSGLFDSYAAASEAVSSLEASGIPHSDISIVASNHDERLDARASEAGHDAGKGASAGAVVGGAGGLMAGLGLLAIPGLGPVVAAGWLASTAIGALAGAAVGGAAGGIVGAMTAEGVPESDANVYAEGIRRGGTLVSARVEDARAADAQAILHRHKTVDITARGQAYRESGWSSFDPNAPEFTRDEIARERGRYTGV